MGTQNDPKSRALTPLREDFGGCGILSSSCEISGFSLTDLALPEPSSARFARGRSYRSLVYGDRSDPRGAPFCGDTIPCDGIGNGNEGLPLRPPVRPSLLPLASALVRRHFFRVLLTALPITAVRAKPAVIGVAIPAGTAAGLGTATMAATPAGVGAAARSGEALGYSGRRGLCRREPGGFRSSCDPSHCDVHRASDTGMSRMGRSDNRNSLGTNMDTSRAPLDNHSHRPGESRSIPPRGSHSRRDTAPPPAAVPLRLQAQRWRDPPR